MDLPSIYHKYSPRLHLASLIWRAWARFRSNVDAPVSICRFLFYRECLGKMRLFVVSLVEIPWCFHHLAAFSNSRGPEPVNFPISGPAMDFHHTPGMAQCGSQVARQIILILILPGADRARASVQGYLAHKKTCPPLGLS